MANTMRWRYGETSPVMIPVDSATVIEIGDMVYQDVDDAKPAASQADQGTETGNQQLFHAVANKLDAETPAWQRPAYSSSTA